MRVSWFQNKQSLMQNNVWNFTDQKIALISSELSCWIKNPDALFDVQVGPLCYFVSKYS